MSEPSEFVAGAVFSKNRLLQGLVAAYLILWAVMAISPIDRWDWLLENVLVFAFIGLLVSTHRAFVFSNRSYVLMAAFMFLHAVGAHYTYGQVPAGYWLKESLFLVRNPFDRIAHFAYGLFMAYPFREVCIRMLRLRGFWTWYLPIDAVLAFSAAYELLEAWAGQMVSPDLAEKYLGVQGDPWDSQKDMTCALAGAVISMIITALILSRRRARAA